MASSNTITNGVDWLQCNSRDKILMLVMGLGKERTYTCPGHTKESLQLYVLFASKNGSKVEETSLQIWMLGQDE